VPIGARFSFSLTPDPIFCGALAYNRQPGKLSGESKSRGESRARQTFSHCKAGIGHLGGSKSSAPANFRTPRSERATSAVHARFLAFHHLWRLPQLR
jgi:hypothetical protein